MKMTQDRLILVRHGQTVANRDGIIMGRTDSPLTGEGLRTAEHVARMLEELQVQAIYSSPLGRAAFTAGICSQQIGAPLHFRAELAELASGQREQTVREDVPGPGRHIRTSWTDRPPGGESYEDAEPRAAGLLGELRPGALPGPTVLVTHAGVARVYLRLLLDLSTGDAVNVSLPHDTMYLVDAGGRVSHRRVGGAPTEGILWEVEER